MRRRRHRLVRLPRRCLHRGGHEVIHEAAALDVARLVVLDLLEQSRRHAHGQAAVNLPVDDHRVDDVSTVVHGHEAADLDHTRAAIDVDHADV